MYIIVYIPIAFIFQRVLHKALIQTQTYSLVDHIFEQKILNFFYLQIKM